MATALTDRDTAIAAKKAALDKEAPGLGDWFTTNDGYLFEQAKEEIRQQAITAPKDFFLVQKANRKEIEDQFVIQAKFDTERLYRVGLPLEYCKKEALKIASLTKKARLTLHNTLYGTSASTTATNRLKKQTFVDSLI